MLKTLYIHVGYPKSASTTLQKCLFSKSDLINYVGPSRDDVCLLRSNDYVRQLYDEIIKPDGVQFDFDSCKQKLETHVMPLFREDKVNLLSHEDFIYNFAVRGTTCRQHKATRLKRLFADKFETVKILIVIRNQFTICRSQYQDIPFDPRSNGLGPAVSFDEWVEMGMQHVNAPFMRAYLYHETIRLYDELFGEENVKVLLFEKLAENAEHFCDDLDAFWELPSGSSYAYMKTKRENVSDYSRWNWYKKKRRSLPSTISFKKMMPDFLYDQLHKFMNSGKRVNTEISARSKALLEEYYGESNQSTIERTALDLKKYGYPMAQR